MSLLSIQALDYIALKPKRLNILHGSVRSGKTTNTLLNAPRRFRNAPKGDIIITGKTERTAYRNVVKPLQEMFGQRRVKYLKGTAEGKLGSRSFYVIGGNDEAAEGKLRGLTVAYWLADELTLNPQSFVAQGLARMSPEGACADWTMNPGPPKHFVKTDYIDREAELDARAWHFLLEHNPNLPSSYIENLKKEYGGPGTLFYQRFIEGRWVLAEGSVYPFFNEVLHVIPSAPCIPDYYTVSVDYGTSDATCFQLFGHMERPLKTFPFAGVKVWLEREYYQDSRALGGQQKTVSEHALDFKEWLGGIQPRHIIIDPSAAAFKLELVKRNYRQVRNAKNDVADGLRTVSRMLKDGSYKVCRAAQQNIDDYGGYVWDEKATARGEDKPLHDNSHTHDAARYALHTIYGRSIQN